MNNVKDYKINIGVFVLFEILQSIEANFDGSLPQDIEEEIDKLKRLIISHFEPNNPKFKDYDYKATEYLMRVYYEDEPFSKIKK